MRQAGCDRADGEDGLAAVRKAATGAEAMPKLSQPQVSIDKDTSKLYCVQV